jgi:hypothetical protein
MNWFSKTGPADCTPSHLGSGPIPGRFERPPPLPWVVRHPHLATALTAVIAILLLLVLASCETPLRTSLSDEQHHNDGDRSHD